MMRKMGFGDTFVSWIQMLHFNASIRFILAKLSSEISVSFSIRQGDPLAMLLSIIYIEPLLVYIERRAVGLTMFRAPNSNTSVVQCVEAYCDDLNVITDQDSDLLLVDHAVKQFEAISGAILSRNLKCKIMGVGSWSQRKKWPLPFVQSVQEIKIFGVFFLNSYVQTLKRNWDFRFKKFQQSVLSWSSRVLENISQRVQILNMFALSRIYYISSVLPLSKTTGKKFEKQMGKFLWSSSGKLLRVSLDDLKLPIPRGGLGLVCIHRMSRSLLLSQLLRLIKNGDSKSLMCLDFWIGEVLEDVVPYLNLGFHSKNTPGYFQALADVVAFGKMADLVTSTSWEMATNKVIYQNQLESLSASKVEQSNGGDYSRVWKRLGLTHNLLEDHDTLFLLVHQKLPVRERLFRIKLEHDPYCVNCLNQGLVEIDDLQHFFCLCKKVNSVWKNVKEVVSNLLQVNVTNESLLCLQFPEGNFDQEICWLFRLSGGQVI